ncbi:MAG: phosphoribosyl-ATP pyrophosphatase [Chloroflexota bacterium]|nr:MAG: phosphoribosyl-ATP pyrophosphatase [Chloroflexota bacterium]
MSETLNELFATIKARKENPPPNSYTAKLFAAGAVEIAKKVGEEAIEVIVASYKESDERLASESADLIYHLLVLLAARQVEWGAVEQELAKRKR